MHALAHQNLLEFAFNKLWPLLLVLNRTLKSLKLQVSHIIHVSLLREIDSRQTSVASRSVKLQSTIHIINPYA